MTQTPIPPTNIAATPSSTEDAPDSARSTPAISDNDPAVEMSAATQQPPPRVIDENTDMSTLTDQEIMRLMESMGQEDVTSKVCCSSARVLSYRGRERGTPS